MPDTPANQGAAGDALHVVSSEDDENNNDASVPSTPAPTAVVPTLDATALLKACEAFRAAASARALATFGIGTEALPTTVE